MTAAARTEDIVRCRWRAFSSGPTPPAGQGRGPGRTVDHDLADHRRVAGARRLPPSQVPMASTMPSTRASTARRRRPGRRGDRVQPVSASARHGGCRRRRSRRPRCITGWMAFRRSSRGRRPVKISHPGILRMPDMTVVMALVTSAAVFFGSGEPRWSPRRRTARRTGRGRSPRPAAARSRPHRPGLDGRAHQAVAEVLLGLPPALPSP